MELLINITGSLIWIAISLAVICLCIVALITLAENWLANGKFDRFRK